MVPQLHGHVLSPEDSYQSLQLPGRRRWALLDEGGGDRPLPAAGEDLPVAAVVAGQGGQVDLGQRLLARAHVGGGDGPGQVGVARGISGQDDEMAAARVGGAGLGSAGEVEGQLGPEHGGDL